jgi:glycosyltransferase involved in cell wall biosynthesis
MKVIAVIPAYNEASVIGEVLDRVRGHVDEIIVVNDGSSDRTGEIASGRGVVVVHHVINRGLGASLGTGFAAAHRRGADVVITLDADGQHDPAEIPKFVEAINGGADFVVGSRMLTALRGMPLHRKLATFAGNAATYALFGAWVTDSQSGYRALSRHAIEKIDIRTNRMEVSSELIAESKRNRLSYREVPIAAIYTEYSLSKGQSFFVGLKTLAKLVLRRLGG